MIKFNISPTATSNYITYGDLVLDSYIEIISDKRTAGIYTIVISNNKFIIECNGEYIEADTSMKYALLLVTIFDAKTMTIKLSENKHLENERFTVLL
jgi:hypothetical protein